MKPGAVTSLALIVLAAGALSYAYLFDRGGAPGREPVEGPRRVFPWLEPLEVRALSLERADGRLAFARTGDAGAATWDMTSPDAEPADPATVDALLADLGAAVRLRDVSLDAAATGLSAPRVRGRLELGGVAHTFALGAPAPLPSGASYMRVDAGGVFVVGPVLTEDLLRAADAYRDRTLVPFGISETARLEVSGGAEPGGAYALVRSGVTFRVDGALRAARREVERVFAALAGMHADSFVVDAGADAPDASPALHVLLAPSSPSRPRVELRLGGACPGAEADVVVAYAPPGRRAACVPESAADGLTPDGGRDALLDRGLFHARADEIAELRVERIGAKGAALDLARRGNGWHERSPEDRDLAGPEVDAANQRAGRLTDVAARDARPAASGPFAAASRVTVVRVDGATEVVEVGAPAPDGVLAARRLDDGALLTFGAEDARDLAASAAP